MLMGITLSELIGYFNFYKLLKIMSQNLVIPNGSNESICSSKNKNNRNLLNLITEAHHLALRHQVCKTF